ncbi:MAG: hypothetical protein QOF83_179 [Solirubrobacteraceae bacterium]|jgi:hypothetical protein|nr:hypothetical protein [Solirubrobacteraceae bacterium]
MAFADDPGALLARSYTLARGPRVRLRLTRQRDLASIESLLRREGTAQAELDLARLLRADPRRQLAITATALLGSVETVIGFGAIDLDAPGATPKTLVVDRELTDGLDRLLSDALIGRAEALRRTRAA